jgi:hypothetical protein
MTIRRLKNTRVFRRGITARSLKNETDDVSLSSGFVFGEGVKVPDEYKGFHIAFDMASKGGGRTYVVTQVGIKDFPAILRVMSEVDRQAAMKAMCEELLRQVGAQAKCDLEIKEKTKEGVLELIFDTYKNAPHGEDGMSKFVESLVEQVNRS